MTNLHPTISSIKIYLAGSIQNLMHISSRIDVVFISCNFAYAC